MRNPERNKYLLLLILVVYLTYLCYLSEKLFPSIKYPNSSYITLCDVRLKGDHRLGNHLFMLSALLDLSIKTGKKIILPHKGWLLDKYFDLDLIKQSVRNYKFEIDRYTDRKEICPCDTINNPHFFHDIRFNTPKFLNLYNSGANSTNLEMCGLSQTYLYTLNPQVEYHLRLLPLLLRDNANLNAFVAIKMFKKLMIEDKLQSFELYSYNGIKNNRTYKSLKSSSSNDATLPYLSDEPFVVGVHFRIGDFRDFLKFGITVANGRYFRKSFGHFIESHRRIVFVVISDDIDSASERFSKYFLNKYSNYTVVHGKDIKIVYFSDTVAQDFAILCHVDGLIISTGTFGWWAAWLNSKAKVIYYENYPLRNTLLARLLDKRHYFPPKWIPIS